MRCSECLKHLTCSIFTLRQFTYASNQITTYVFTQVRKNFFNGLFALLLEGFRRCLN